MSAGKFVKVGYTSEAGGTHFIKVQPETVNLSIAGVLNSASATVPDSTPSVRVGGSRRRRGTLYSRMVTIQFDVGAAPAGYIPEGRVSLPWLDRNSFAALKTNDTVQYLGAAGKLVSKLAEVYR